MEHAPSRAKRPATSLTPPTACAGDSTAEGLGEIILPALWERRAFDEKAAGSPALSQMWAFQDKQGRHVCLTPEATGAIRELYRERWERTLPKPIRLFSITRCYRYERPQAGRYREFTQVGVEALGPDVPKAEAVSVLRKCLDEFGLSYTFAPAAKRGLTYYVEDGFEVECDQLGAQKQVAGGGRYPEGIGWAIGLDRLLLALNPRAQGAT